MASLALALSACSLIPTPTPEPPTPTPRARAEQVAMATEVAAKITATAAARALLTATPVPRADASARPSLSGKAASTRPLKATPVAFNAVPLADGRRYRDPAGDFALIVPRDQDEYPPAIVSAAALFIAPFALDDRQAEMNAFVWDMPPQNWVVPLSDITNMAMAEVRQTFGRDYAFIRLERIETRGVQIDRLICRDELDDYTLVQAYMVIGHTLHMLTFRSPTEAFEANLPIFDAILASYGPAGRPPPTARPRRGPWEAGDGC